MVHFGLKDGNTNKTHTKIKTEDILIYRRSDCASLKLIFRRRCWKLCWSTWWIECGV